MARVLLKEGYDLARASHCAEAVPLFARSADFDPQPKTYLNLARCEEESLHFGDALRHWVTARDLARDQSLRALASEASARLQALESRMPRLTLKLTQGAPSDLSLLRDDVRVPPEALGRPLPIDPGMHRIVVEAKGYAARSMALEIAPGEHLEIVALPGERLIAPAASVEALRPAAPTGRLLIAPAPPRSPRASSISLESRSGRDTTPASVLFWSGVGVASAGIVTGAVTGALTLGKAGLKNECPEGRCPPAVMAEVARARTLGTLSTVAFTVGAGGALAAAMGFYFDHRTKDATPSPTFVKRVVVIPALGGIHASAEF